MDINKKIGERIKMRRKELNLTQEQVGDSIGVNKSTIQRYENGLFKDLKMPVIQSIARVLKVNPDWLVLKSQTKNSHDNINNINISYSTLNKEEQILLFDYRSLNQQGKEYIRQTIDMAKVKYKNVERVTLVAARGNSHLEIVADDEAVRKDIENYVPPTKL